MPTLPELLKTMVDVDGSDLHIATNSPPQIRIHGHLSRLQLPDMNPAETKNLVYSVLTDSQKKQFEEVGAQVGADEIRAVEEAWTALLSEVRANRDLDPASPQAQALAQRWDELTMVHRA